MNIIHVVLFKFKDSTSDEQKRACFLKLKELTKELPIIQSFRWGKYQSQEGLNQGFSHAFIMTFLTEKDRDEYLTHPKHVVVAQFIQQYLNFPEGVIAFDSSFKKDNVFNAPTANICLSSSIKPQDAMMKENKIYFDNVKYIAKL